MFYSLHKKCHSATIMIRVLPWYNWVNNFYIGRDATKKVKHKKGCIVKVWYDPSCGSQIDYLTTPIKKKEITFTIQATEWMVGTKYHSSTRFDSIYSGWKCGRGRMDCMVIRTIKILVRFLVDLKEGWRRPKMFCLSWNWVGCLLLLLLLSMVLVGHPDRFSHASYWPDKQKLARTNNNNNNNKPR